MKLVCLIIILVVAEILAMKLMIDAVLFLFKIVADNGKLLLKIPERENKISDYIVYFFAFCPVVNIIPCLIFCFMIHMYQFEFVNAFHVFCMTDNMTIEEQKKYDENPTGLTAFIIVHDREDKEEEERKKKESEQDIKDNNNQE